MSNSVLKKIVYSVTVSLASPLCISKGDGALTDNDVLVGGDGVPFIPGSSMAGAMRGYIEKGKSKDCIFGYEDMSTQKGRMSSLFVSDCFFDEKVVTAVRDGVALDSHKTAVPGAKFDMEVIDSGATGHFWLEVVLRENDAEKVLLGELEQIFTGWREKEIRLGSKKTRGYGEIRLLRVTKKVFDKTNILEYKDAYCAPEKQDESWETISFDNLGSGDGKYVTVTLPLRLEGGISIRQYAAKKGEPDFVHITADGKPVIPGTSFAGAIRHRMQDMLEMLGAKNAEEIIREIYGYVDADAAKGKNDTSAAKASNIIISECVLEGAQKLQMVRTGISRFESGVKSGALFNEISYVGGTTTLEIRVKKTETLNETIGLLLPVLKDVQNGFLAVGGQTAVGRGLFAGNGEIGIDAELTEADYNKAAFAALRRA